MYIYIYIYIYKCMYISTSIRTIAPVVHSQHQQQYNTLRNHVAELQRRVHRGTPLFSTET